MMFEATLENFKLSLSLRVSRLSNIEEKSRSGPAGATATLQQIYVKGKLV